MVAVPAGIDHDGGLEQEPLAPDARTRWRPRALGCTPRPTARSPARVPRRDAVAREVCHERGDGVGRHRLGGSTPTCCTVWPESSPPSPRSASCRFASRYSRCVRVAEAGSARAASTRSASSDAVPASEPSIAPNTSTTGGSAGSAEAVMSRLAASSSGASGAHACHASTTAPRGRAPRTAGRSSSPVRAPCGRRATSRRRTCRRRPPAAPRTAPRRGPRRSRRCGRRPGRPCAEQLVGREAVRAAEDPEPAAEREARDADGRPAPGGDRQAVCVERVVHGAEPRPGADGHHAVGDRHGVHRRYVDHDSGGASSAPRSSGRRCAAPPAGRTGPRTRSPRPRPPRSGTAPRPAA